MIAQRFYEHIHERARKIIRHGKRLEALGPVRPRSQWSAGSTGAIVAARRRRAPDDAIFRARRLPWRWRTRSACRMMLGFPSGCNLRGGARGLSRSNVWSPHRARAAAVARDRRSHLSSRRSPCAACATRSCVRRVQRITTAIWRGSMAGRGWGLARLPRRPALSRDPYAVSRVVKDAVRRLSRNNHCLWLWVPAQGRDDGGARSGAIH